MTKVAPSKITADTAKAIGSPKAQDNTYTASWTKLRTAYHQKTPLNSKALDFYLLFCFFTGTLQLLYCCLTKGRDYQSFLGGFIACVGSFVLAANVRLQTEGDKGEDPLLKAKSLWGFALGHVILFFLVANFI